MDILFKIFLQIIKYRWLALSEVFNVPNQFFDHPGDMVHHTVHQYLGFKFADLVMSGKLQGRGFDISDLVQQAAQNYGVSPSEVKYNYGLCYRIGERIFAKVRSGELGLEDEMLAYYERILDEALMEMYAEMINKSVFVRHEFMFTEGGRNIISHCIQLLSIFAGRTIDMLSVQVALDEYGRRFVASSIIPQVITDDLVDTSTPVNASTVDYEVYRTNYELFCKGDLSSLPTGISNDLLLRIYDYNIWFRTVLSKYSIFTNTQIDNSYGSILFDPNLPYSQVRDILYAMSSSRVEAIYSAVFFDNRSEEEVIAELERITKILQDFFVSGAF